MNSLLIRALQTIVRAIVGTLDYELVCKMVNESSNSPLSGDEKRELVIAELRAVGLSISQSLLNLAIEVAVTALKNRK